MRYCSRMLMPVITDSNRVRHGDLIERIRIIAGHETKGRTKEAKIGPHTARVCVIITLAPVAH